MATERRSEAATLASAERTIERLRADLSEAQAQIQQLQRDFYVALIRLGGRLEIIHGEPFPSATIHCTQLADRSVFKLEIAGDLPERRDGRGPN
ncbi:MAG: hypothetical protein ACOY3Y_15495 [Acidobacteriota bacterium]